MIKFYNTLTRKTEPLKIKRGGRVNIFVCGPTVYDLSHIGHARTYIVFDILVKYLRLKGLGVFYLQNITDIDDKIIARAKEAGITPEKIAKKFELEYLKDMKTLGVDSVNKYARATDHIKEIISQVGRLMKKGYAYQTDDGIYYDISKFKNYGKLSGRTVEQAEDAISRIDEASGKKNRGDFALWKFSPPSRKASADKQIDEPSWPSPWGRGRPGWHIEDTAITEKYFGPKYHIHCGAKDLIFPHHEAEIAQMEAVSGKKPLAKLWMHTGFLTVKGEKMSKSLGNFITIRDFLKEYPPEVLRFIVLSSRWRSALDYTPDIAQQARESLRRIADFLGRVGSIKQKSNKTIRQHNNKTIKQMSKFQRFEKQFDKTLEDDFNTPKALGLLFDFIKDANKSIDAGTLPSKDAKRILEFFRKWDRVFGIIPPRAAAPPEILRLAEERKQLRKEKKWKEADAMRLRLKGLGWNVEDTPQGPKVKRSNQ